MGATMIGAQDKLSYITDEMWSGVAWKVGDARRGSVALVDSELITA